MTDNILAPEHEELRATVRAFLAEACPPSAVRRLMADPGAHDARLWRRITEELGLTGLTVAEEYGGAGGGMVETAVVCEELGRALTPVPYLGTAVLAPHVLEGGDAVSRLAGIADGSTVATVVLDGDLRASGGRLTGTARLVLDGFLADLVLCPVDGGMYAVPGDAAGLRREPLVGLDQTRRFAELRFDAVAATRVGDDAALPRSRDLATVALAAGQVGGARRCLEMALEYARTRVQFGRPIGSFQAVKHKLADMLLRVESAHSAAYHAASVADTAPAELPTYAALAGSYCSTAYLHAAGENVQIHGGIGVTWEHDAHLHLKRAASDARLFGDPAEHRSRIAASLGL